MPEACIKMGPVEADIGCADSERRTTLKLLVFTLLIGAYQASAWTYHYGNGNMSWESAREWCKTNYTNMVFIRNINENKHLNATLPALNRHYWIGVEKINDTWTWAETQKPVPEDVQNWADNEPSTLKNENCVEMYIYVNKSGRGKWNNDRCTKWKKPLCYQDSCLNSTCNHRGECKEEIGNYTCECWPGFHGNNCEHALSCVDPQNPANGNISCTDKYGKFQYESFCKFSCDEGYELNGRNASLCQHTGEWSEPAPTCLAWNVSYGQQNQIAIVSSVLGTAGLSLSSIPIVYILRYFRRKKEGDNSHIVKTIKEDPPNTFENPAFEEKDMDSLDL